MITELQKMTAQAIVNIFETGAARGDYGKVTLLSGDTGHLTYGRAQTTLASGNLFLLIKDYCNCPGAALAAELRPYIGRLEERDLGLDHDAAFRRFLREAGEDAVMCERQDMFFDRVYWEPALKSAQFIGSTSPLGAAIVYDSRVHGSWHAIRDRTNDSVGRLGNVGEKVWFAGYVRTRRDWLANHPNALLHRTVYRMDAFQELIDQDCWQLDLPLTVRGVLVDEATLTASVRASAEGDDGQLLKLRQPFLQGDNVRRVQERLADTGIEVSIDGIFGPGTEKAVIKFQIANGLTVDGIVGPATRAALGL